MATRISVVKNPDGQFTGWACKHSGKTPGKVESEGHVILCERCASAVKNGAELLNDDTRQPGAGRQDQRGSGGQEGESHGRGRWTIVSTNGTSQK